MRNQNNEYISRLKLDDFQVLLEEFDIELNQTTQQSILNMIKNNQYALAHEQYHFVLENYIKKLTSEFTCQKILILLNSYFKPLLNV
ncbi:hypothetical protein NMU03_01590 [Allocoprobacillus halotolerans]|uniref:Uncharacterized protein n=1 Tax=Allocoprobacillus halotolerans TaxID=2944914 RepID=A0ABY5I6I5_9FIRM|nr:hypothetical protein [Allocoprobacillus halotolerans]UTY39555.1 hypothetical protein NMU03_01590 [Allocoprobacillus halotolerans]